MATHSSIPAWRIPWAEEPGGLQPMGLQESDVTGHALMGPRVVRGRGSLKVWTETW